MPFHCDVTMETINDIFPPLDPPLGPDLDTQNFIGMGNGALESSFPQLSPSSPTMGDSMLDDSDDFNNLGLGEHPFMEVTSGIHIKQEYEDEDEGVNSAAALTAASILNHVNNTAHNNATNGQQRSLPTTVEIKPQISATVTATTASSDPSMIRGLLQRPLPAVVVNGKASVNGTNGNVPSNGMQNGAPPGVVLQLGRGVYTNSQLQSLLNGCTVIKEEPKDEAEALMSEDEGGDESGEESGEDEDEEEDADVDDEGDMTAGSTISSTVSSALSSTVSSATATPVVSPAQSPGPVLSANNQPVFPGPTNEKPVVGPARGVATHNGHATTAQWTSSREKKPNQRWATGATTYSSKVERKELRKRKPQSYALLKEEPLPSKKKRSYNFRQFRRTIEMSFSSEGEKQEFDESLESLKQWANMKTVTQFLQFAMRQLQELRSQGQSLIVDPPQKNRNKKKMKRVSPDQTISATDAQSVELFATCTPSIQHLVTQAHDMGVRRMPCPRVSLTRRDMHVGVMRVENSEEGFTWKSSPYLAGTEDYLVNYRLAVGMLSTGVSSNTYQRFSQGADFGSMDGAFIEERCMPSVSAAVGRAVQESTDLAVADVCQRHPTGAEIETHVETSVVNDKRHTTVLAMETDSNKILGSVIITKSEDSSTTKAGDGKDDDVVGSQKLLRNLMDKGVSIRNRNSAKVNGSMTKGPGSVAIDEHMIWKAIRDDLKNYGSIVSGPQKDMGRTWHPELADKEDGIRKQLYRSLRFSNGDANQLRRGLCAIPRHYQGSHELCHSTSPCRQAGMLNSDKIKDIKALQILTVFIQHTNLYRYPSMILEHIKATPSSQSQQHRQPPRISLRSFCGDVGGPLSIPLYNLRTGLYVLWWNENSCLINAGGSGVSPHHLGGSAGVSLENVPTTCRYAHDIWKKFLTKTC